MIFVWMVVWNGMVQYKIMFGWFYESIQEFYVCNTYLPRFAIRAKCDKQRLVRAEARKSTSCRGHGKGGRRNVSARVREARLESHRSVFFSAHMIIENLEGIFEASGCLSWIKSFNPATKQWDMWASRGYPRCTCTCTVRFEQPNATKRNEVVPVALFSWLLLC